MSAAEFAAGPVDYLADGAAPCRVPPGVSPYGDAGLQGAAAAPLSPVTGRSFPVDSKAAFKDAVRDAGPGDEIVIANGVYRDWGDFEVDASGKDGAPLILRAETPQGVTFTGAATLFLKGSHLEVAGFEFKDTTGWAIVVAPGRTQLRITGNRFENTGTAGRKEVLRVYSEASHIEIDNNELTDVNAQGIILFADTKRAQHHRVHHNWFHDVPRRGGNGHEAFTSIGGQGHVAVADMKNVIDHNFFERWNGESELISLKASGYEVRDNSVLASEGLFNIREANRVTIADNILVDSGAIGVNGSGHRITGNKCYGKGGCLTLFGLSQIDVEGSGRPAAKTSRIADNLFSSSDAEPVVVAYRDGSVVDAAADNVLENNVIATKAGRWLKVQGNPDSVFLDRNAMTGNRVFSGAGPLSLPAGNLNEAPGAADLTPPPAAACGGSG